MKLTIDPGLSGTGWAYWDRNWKLIRHGVIKPPAKHTWEQKMQFIIQILESHVYELGLNQAYVEFPSFFQSTGGQVTARSGALVKLSSLVGAIMFTFSAKPVRVNEWKGQLPKEIIIKRIKRILPNVKAKSHDWDAIGIGLYLRGDLK